MRMDSEASAQQTLREGSGSQKIIDPSQIYDPLLVLLKVKLHLNNQRIIAGTGIVAIGMIGTILLTNGWNSSFFSSPLQPLALSALYLTFFGTYLFLPDAVAHLFNHLWEHGVIGASYANTQGSLNFWEIGVLGDSHADTQGSLSYQEFVQKRVRKMRALRWAAVALLGATSNPLFLLFVHPIWRGTPLWFTVIGNCIGLVGDYAAALVLIWLVMMAITTHQLFHFFDIRVKPLHPDGSGGLGPFNHFLWMTIPLMIVIGCGIAGWGSIFSHGIDRILLLGDLLSYLFAASLLLGTWLVLPHQAMVIARDKLLRPLTNEHERVLGETMSGAMSDLAAINEGTERLVALRKRYEEVRDSFPTWPIEVMQLPGLVTLLILPALPTLLPLLLDLFTKK
jgi:hypothetical protein